MSQFAINTDTVCQWLLATHSSTSGASADDIITGTSLSQSTVYRILRSCPAIVKLHMPGKRALYYCDVSLYNSMDKSGAKPRGIRINVSPLIKDRAESLGMLDGLAVFDDAISNKRISGYLKDLLDTYNETQDFQRETGRIEPDTYAKYRAAVEKLQEFSIVMYFWLDKQRKHPQFIDAENFWAIWPLDEQDGKS